VTIDTAPVDWTASQRTVCPALWELHDTAFIQPTHTYCNNVLIYCSMLPILQQVQTSFTSTTCTNRSNSDSPSPLHLAFPLSVPSTHHTHYPSPLHSFIPSLEPIPFLQILPTVTFLFFFSTDSTDSPFFYFSVFLFSTF